MGLTELARKRVACFSGLQSFSEIVKIWHCCVVAKSEKMDYHYSSTILMNFDKYADDSYDCTVISSLSIDLSCCGCEFFFS